jgi:hypothetical protein
VNIGNSISLNPTPGISSRLKVGCICCTYVFQLGLYIAKV